MLQITCDGPTRTIKVTDAATGADLTNALSIQRIEIVADADDDVVVANLTCHVRRMDIKADNGSEVSNG